MTRGLVLDSSIAAGWCFDDEADAKIDKLFERVRDEGGLVPALWHWEVANALATAVRRNRITFDSAVERLASLSVLPISTDSETPVRLRTHTFLLAQTHNLTAYDAAYLELAQRTGFELASKDAELCAAAASAGVKLAL